MRLCSVYAPRYAYGVENDCIPLTPLTPHGVAERSGQGEVVQ